MKRSEIRELAFKLIYSLEIQKEENKNEQINLFLENNDIKNQSAIDYIKDCITRYKWKNRWNKPNNTRFFNIRVENR